jgi:alkylation response protein AidB-like acyl-CoA dehydrogenase
MKAIATRLSQEFSEAGVEMEGYYGTLWQGAGNFEGEGAGGAWGTRFLSDRCMTIAGGTSEIQRNIIATRGLGLPRG